MHFTVNMGGMGKLAIVPPIMAANNLFPPHDDGADAPRTTPQRCPGDHPRGYLGGTPQEIPPWAWGLGGSPERSNWTIQQVCTQEDSPLGAQRNIQTNPVGYPTR